MSAPLGSLPRHRHSISPGGRRPKPHTAPSAVSESPGHSPAAPQLPRQRTARTWLGVMPVLGVWRLATFDIDSALERLEVAANWVLSGTVPELAIFRGGGLARAPPPSRRSPSAWGRKHGASTTAAAVRTLTNRRSGVRRHPAWPGGGPQARGGCTGLRSWVAGSDTARQGGAQCLSGRPGGTPLPPTDDRLTPRAMCHRPVRRWGSRRTTGLSPSACSGHDASEQPGPGL